jgi:endonuclease YncB( thermonuclease family)
MRKKFHKMFLIVLVAGGFFVFAFFNARAHSPYAVHYHLSEASVNLYNLHYPENALTAQQKQWIAEGSAEEDTPFLRSVHHFYDPINNEGLQGLISSKEWARDDLMQALNRFQLGGEPRVYTWGEAIAAYNRGDYRHAYKALGHILHLMQDASVPAHTRQDPHVHFKEDPLDIELYGGADPFEQQAKLRSLKISSLQGLRPTSYKNLDAYFDAMALYSNRYFLSKDSLGYYDLPKITRMDAQYIYGIDEDGTEIRLAKIPRKLSSRFIDVGIKLDRSSFSDPAVINDYWSRLAPRSVEHSAGVIKLFHDTVVKQEQQEEKKMSFWNEIMKGIAGRARSAAELIKFVWNQYAPDIATFKIDPGLTFYPSLSPPYVIPHIRFNFSISAYQKEAEKRAAKTFAKQLQTPADILERQFQEFINEQQIAQKRKENARLPLVQSEFSSEKIAQNTNERQDGFGEISENNQPEFVLVTKVFDGDTIELAGGQRVRLMGIDAPDFPSDCHAQESADYLKKLVLNKSVVLKKGSNDKDAYGRLLRYIWVGDMHVNAHLVETGYAYVFGFTHSLENEFFKLQQNAKQNQLGLWGSACPKKDNRISTSEGSMGYGPRTGNNNITTTTNETTTSTVQKFAVVINEIAWMGTAANMWDEWIELFNTTSADVSLDGWKIVVTNPAEEFEIKLSNTITPGFYFLLERRESATNMVADLIYGGRRMNNKWAVLKLYSADGMLVDKVDCARDEEEECKGWFAGKASPDYVSMERIDPLANGSNPENWANNDRIIRNASDAEGGPINGTPRQLNSASYPDDESG